MIVVYELDIRFEGSWTNVFRDLETKAPLFTSTSNLKEGMKKYCTQPLHIDETQGMTNIVDYVRALQQRNPLMPYRVPENYDNALQGMLGTLVGDVRSPILWEEDHLVHRAFQACRYQVDIESISNELIRLHNPNPTDLKNGGAGLIIHDALYSGCPESNYFFGFLGLSLQEMEDACEDIKDDLNLQHPKFNGAPTSPKEFIKRIHDLKVEQEKIFKQCRFRETSPLPRLTGLLRSMLTDTHEQTRSGLKNNNTSDPDFHLESWNYAGALIVYKLSRLSEEQRKLCIQKNLLSKNGLIPGVNASGRIGHVTDKGVYSFASGKRAKSSHIPYEVQLPIIDRNNQVRYINAGILIKSGTLTMAIEDDAIGNELFDAIEASATSTFSFGSKGIAYVSRMKRPKKHYL